MTQNTIESILEEFDKKLRAGHFGPPSGMSKGLLAKYLSQSLTKIREEGYQEGYDKGLESGYTKATSRLESAYLESYKQSLIEKIEKSKLPGLNKAVVYSLINSLKDKESMAGKYGTVGSDGCPCGAYDKGGFVFDVHCWRANCQVCDFSGVHIIDYPDGKYAEARKRADTIRRHIKSTWHTDCQIIIGPRNNS